MLLVVTDLYAQDIHQYQLDFNEELSIVKVKINLAYAETSLKARNTRATLFTENPSECNSGKPIRYNNKRLLLKPNINCLSYSMQLHQKRDKRLLDSSSSTLVTTPSEWLFLPTLNNSDKVNIKVSVAKEHNLSVPWSVIDSDSQHFEIEASPESSDGLMVIGKFKSSTISHKGTKLRIAYLPGRVIDVLEIEAWLKKTIDNVSQVYGRFPHPNPQVIISPQGKSWSRRSSPVPFGRVVRDYGEGVHFFIDQRQSLNDFNNDWTATHEFSHLMLPYINWKNRWLSEGFASYYQNLLMARGGIYNEKYAWQKLYDGFMRGKRSAPELSPNSAAREGRGGNMKVYWSGAALFFAADVELRLLSNNESSLDTTLDKLQQCCLPSGKAWSGTRLMRKLDELSDTRVFSDLYKEYANSATFVDFEKSFAALGITIINGKVSLSEDPELKRLRQSFITAKF